MFEFLRDGPRGTQTFPQTSYPSKLNDTKRLTRWVDKYIFYTFANKYNLNRVEVESVINKVGLLADAELG